MCECVCVFAFDPPLRQDMQADRQKFASAVAPGICLICPFITRQVAFLQRTWAAISFLRERDTQIWREKAGSSRLKGEPGILRETAAEKENK